ncbi:MAG: phosphate ABC transporter substrate-binding protein [Desulfobacteraceae bacterium]|nr:MAG: phosphate ABC transporter substrate-binding protein [Desulfobacteraceae bacterium]
MKGILKQSLWVLCSFGIIAATAVAQEKEFDGTLRIGGSTTLLPVIADCASQFMEKYDTWNKIDPSLPNKKILVFVTGGGSGFGINAAINHTVEIGMSSRDLKAEEKTKLGDYREFLVSKDCLAFAVNKKNPLAKLDNLTAQDIVKIYSGEAKNYSDVRKDLGAKPILVQMRDMAGGSTEMIKTMIMKNANFTPHAVQVPSQGANLKKVEANVSAITYISSVIALQSDKLKVFKYEGTEPSNANAVSGKYTLTRPLILIVKGTPSKAAQLFIDFVLNDGQKIIVEHGYVPVKEMN